VWACEYLIPSLEEGLGLGDRRGERFRGFSNDFYAACGFSVLFSQALRDGGVYIPCREEGTVW
jgi:hypothetical protein